MQSIALTTYSSVSRSIETINIFIRTYFILAQEFTKTKFDEICINLSPDSLVNPHKSVLGLGNYDVNSLMQALASKNYELTWFDKRKEITAESIEVERAFGFILNIISNYTLGFVTIPIKSRHWVSLRKLSDGNFYNLDSKLDRPKLIGSDQDFIEYIRKEMTSNDDMELFIVIDKN